MQLRTILSTSVMAAIVVTIAHPVSAQPVPAIAVNACTQRVAEEMVVSTVEIELTGAGTIDATTGVRTLFMRNRRTGQTAECRVNTIDGTVLSVRVSPQPGRPQPPTPPQTLPQASINACIQQTAEAMVVPASNIQMTSAGVPDVNGVRTLFMRDRTNGRTAECRVNTITNTVISVRLTTPTVPPGNSAGVPVSPKDPIARKCQAAIGNQIRRSYANVQFVTFFSDTTRKFFVSNAVSGIRGQGEFSQSNAGFFRFNYNCNVNVRTGQVTSATQNIIR